MWERNHPASVSMHTTFRGWWNTFRTLIQRTWSDKASGRLQLRCRDKGVRSNRVRDGQHSGVTRQPASQRHGLSRHPGSSPRPEGWGAEAAPWVGGGRGRHSIAAKAHAGAQRTHGWRIALTLCRFHELLVAQSVAYQCTPLLACVWGQPHGLFALIPHAN